MLELEPSQLKSEASKVLILPEAPAAAKTNCFLFREMEKVFRLRVATTQP